jgi:preprotein translocase subunit SecD
MNTAVAVVRARAEAAGAPRTAADRQGKDQILVRVFGSMDSALPDLISRQRILEFAELVTGDEPAKWENELGKWKPASAVIDGEQLDLTSLYIEDDSFVSRTQEGSLVLVFTWNQTGARLSEAITSRLIGKPMAMFEYDRPLLGDDGRPIAPVVRAIIYDRVQIEGLKAEEAARLSKQLNAGRLPVPLAVVEVKTLN